MAGRNVEDDPYAEIVRPLYEGLEICVRAQAGIDLVEVDDVVAPGNLIHYLIVHDRHEPDGVEAHLRDVVQLAGDVAEAAARIPGSAGSFRPETEGEYLVDHCVVDPGGGFLVAHFPRRTILLDDDSHAAALCFAVGATEGEIHVHFSGTGGKAAQVGIAGKKRRYLRGVERIVEIGAGFHAQVAGNRGNHGGNGNVEPESGACYGNVGQDAVQRVQAAVDHDRIGDERVRDGAPVGLDAELEFIIAKFERRRDVRFSVGYGYRAHFLAVAQERGLCDARIYGAVEARDVGAEGDFLPDRGKCRAHPLDGSEDAACFSFHAAARLVGGHHAKLCAGRNAAGGLDPENARIGVVSVQAVGIFNPIDMVDDGNERLRGEQPGGEGPVFDLLGGLEDHGVRDGEHGIVIVRRVGPGIQRIGEPGTVGACDVEMDLHLVLVGAAYFERDRVEPVALEPDERHGRGVVCPDAGRVRLVRGAPSVECAREKGALGKNLFGDVAEGDGKGLVPGPVPDQGLGAALTRCSGPVSGQGLGAALTRCSGPVSGQGLGAALTRCSGPVPDQGLGAALTRCLGLGLGSVLGMSLGLGGMRPGACPQEGKRHGVQAGHAEPVVHYAVASIRASLNFTKL